MLPKTKPADEDVLDWWDKTIEMCTKRADGIEMCIDDLATAIREQRQTSQGLGLSLGMEGKNALPAAHQDFCLPQFENWRSYAVPTSKLEITKEPTVPKEEPKEEPC